MKRLLTTVFCACVAVVTLFLFCNTTNAATDGIYTYTVSNGEATITACDTSVSGSITIPSTLGGYPVTSIGYAAFRDCSSLTSVTIGSGVTTIGDYAFKSCSSLTSVTIPYSVTSIGNYAFYYCTGLTEINYNAKAMTDLTSSSDVFYHAGTAGSGIKVTFGDGVEKIPAYMFNHCYSLTSVTIGNSVTSIGDYAFCDCTGLTSVTIPDSVTSIGDYAFCGCGGLTSVTIPDSVTSIGGSAFSRCTGLTSVTIGNSVTSIGDAAFYHCTGLTSVTIPDSVTSIGGGAFSHCTGLTEINYNAKAVTSSSSVFYNAGTAGSGIKVTFGDGVEKIPAYMFEHCYSLTNVTIPDSVTSIGDDAFYHCTGLTSVTIPDSVTSIGGCAFCGCDGLTSVTIPDSVTTIGNWAFSDCSRLTSVTIGNSVTSIGYSAFSHCTGLTSVTIGNSVTSIGDAAFYDCDSLTSVTIGNSVTSIGGGAFYDCDGLTNVTIPDSVTSIGDRAFSDCDGLTKVTIPDSVISIGKGAFEYCSSLTSVTIGNSVTSIGGGAFAYCTGLTEINYNAKAVTDLTSSSSVFNNAGTAGSGIKVTFGEKVKKVPDYLFSTQYSLFPKIREIVFVGNAPTIGSKSFNEVTTSAYYPYGNDTWTSKVMLNYGGRITWEPYSDAEAVSVICNGTTSYVVGDELEKNSISVTIERSDGCIEKYNYASGKITLGEYDMSKSGKQSITVTCKDVTAQLNIYIHDLTSETMPANDYPESSHNYEDNLDKTYTYTADGAYSLDVTFSNETEAETNIDYIYVNGTTYTGKELANKTVHINGDTLTVRLVSDGSDGAYGFSIDSIIANYLVHEYTDTVVAPTCTEQGYTTHTCACGESHVDSYVDALGHDLVHHDGKAATCTEKGWEAYDTCSRCDYTTYKEIPATGHSYTSVVTEPTCTEQGYTTHTCSRCDDSYVDTYVDALGHDLGEWTETKAATCTEKGAERRDCSRCEHYETREIEVLGHDYKDTVTDPTCTEQGYTTHTCSRCDDSYVDSYVDALGHDLGEWTETKAATCTEKGAERRDCSRCEHYETREIEVLGHDYKDTVTDPTCTEQGYTTHTCTRCNDSYVDSYMDALGHCFKNGVCTVCGAKDPDYKPEPVEFSDVSEKAWYYGAVEFAVSNGLMNGVDKDKFAPEATMTRAMLVTVLWRYEGEPDAPANTFSDVKAGTWYADAVSWAAANNIVGGVGNNKFDPEGNITREQMATILYRYCNGKGIDTSKQGSLSGFPDADKVSSYAKTALQWAVAEGIIGGSDGMLLPQGNATRAQVATILMRFIENIV